MVASHYTWIDRSFTTGKGLTICVTVIPGDFSKSSGEAVIAKQALRKAMDDEKVKGFADVLIAKDTSEGLCHL